MIRITSKQHNFRRCGMAHPKGSTEHPNSRFSKKELAILEAEPMLTVVSVINKLDPPEENEPDAAGETEE